MVIAGMETIPSRGSVRTGPQLQRPLRPPRTCESPDDNVFHIAGPAALPDRRGNVSEIPARQPAVVRPVGEPQGQGDTSGWLTAPFGQTFDRKDARQRQESLGRRDCEGGAAALEGPFREPEAGHDLRNGGGSDGQVQRVTKHLVEEGVRTLPHSFQQAVNPLDIDASEDRCVDGVKLVVHIGVEARRKGDTGNSGRVFAPGTPGIVDQGRCGPATGDWPLETGGERLVGASKAGVEQSRRPGVSLTELDEFPPTRREDHRADHAGRIPKAKHQRDSRAQPRTGLQREERRSGLDDQIRAGRGSAA